MMEEVIEPEVVDFISDAVQAGPGGEKFDIARKIITLAALLGKDVASAETTATETDGALFAKSVACQVGDGKMSAEEGAEAIVDRKASGFVAAARSMIAEAVESGCEMVGTAIGSIFGAPNIGYMIGSAVGHFLNEPVGELVSRGAPVIVSYAQKAWQGVKSAVSSCVEKVTSFLFS